MKRLYVNLLQIAVLTIYKSFIRPYEYDDILYNKSGNGHLQNKIEKVQCKACLTVTIVIQEASRGKLYEELGLH